MRVSGTLKDGYGLSGEGGAAAAFNFNNLRDQNIEVGRSPIRLQQLGSIGPKHNYGVTKWEIGPGSFDIEVPIPEQLESNDIRLVFVVWGSQGEDIGAACVKG